MSWDEEDDDSQRTCTDCGALSPKVRTGYTLISKAHGWRLSRRKEGDVYVMEWRCPPCWTKQREASLTRSGDDEAR